MQQKQPPNSNTITLNWKKRLYREKLDSKSVMDALDGEAGPIAPQPICPELQEYCTELAILGMNQTRQSCLRSKG